MLTALEKHFFFCFVLFCCLINVLSGLNMDYIMFCVFVFS